jgi:thiamine-phosphate pyrophosphorylase
MIHRRNALEQGLYPFYPLFPDASWVERLVPLGIKTVQLRYKGSDHKEIRRQVERSLQVCIAHGCTLVVNDHWREALALGAEHLHLGQDDLMDADLSTIKAREMLVGISTHNDAELQLALTAGANSIALGPIYQSSAKDTGHAPQGQDRISEWRKKIGDVPLIAIGGITLDKASAITTAGADTIAVITDVIGNPDPEQRTRDWLAWQKSQLD